MKALSFIGPLAGGSDRMTLPMVPWETSSTITADAILSSTPLVPQQTFEPVLNVPALGTFLFIGVAFGALRWRVSQIEEAARERTLALEALRIAKSAELEGSGEEAGAALERYRASWERVEELRYVVPGLVRITTPSTSLSSSRLAREQEQAGRQFLGIEPEEPLRDESKRTSAESPQSLPLPLLVVLSIVVLSQVGLLSLLSQDPLSSSASLL